MSGQLAIGIIGGGMICQVAHLPFYAADSRCRIVGLAESRPSLVTALQQQYPAVPVVRDYRQLLRDPEVSAVVIVAPRDVTAPMILETLSAGKDVIAEKPMVHTVEQGQRLLDKAAENGRQICIGFMKRYDPGVQLAHDEFARLMSGGQLGRLLYARFYDFSKSYAVPPPPHKRPEESRSERFDTWPVTPDWLPESRKDAYAWFMNAASHDVNLLRYFFPDAVEVQSATAPTDDALLATLLCDGVPVQLDIAKSAAGLWLEGAEFVFEKGRLLLEIPSPMARDRVAAVRIDSSETAVPAGPRTGEDGWCFARQANAFVDSLVQRRPSLTPAKDIQADMVLIEKIWRKACGI